MKIYIGTSGWLHDWNFGGDLQWYIDKSNLNSVELNESFNRFPIPNMVKYWYEKTKESGLRWSIKANRSITHSAKLGDKAGPTWKRLEKTFKPLDPNIDFYLFQLPPVVTFESIDKIEKFYKMTQLGERFALEARHQSFFDNIDKIKDIGLTFVSLDSPTFSRDLYNFSGCIYLRLHGRKLWYSHKYTKEELQEIADNIKKANPEKVYIFFNNNHNMLLNAKMMKILLTKDNMLAKEIIIEKGDIKIEKGDNK